jgi:hypothetical protein
MLIKNTDCRRLGFDSYEPPTRGFSVPIQYQRRSVQSYGAANISYLTSRFFRRDKGAQGVV